MAGAATVAVRPKNGNAVIAFRPESAGKFWRACPVLIGGPWDFIRRGERGTMPSVPSPAWLLETPLRCRQPPPPGRRRQRRGGGGESSSSRKPGAGASPRSVPLRLRQRPDRLQGCRRNARPPLEGRQHSPRRFPFVRRTEARRRISAPAQRSNSTDFRRAVRQFVRRYAAPRCGCSLCAWRRAVHGQGRRARAGGRGNAPGGATPGFQDHGARS